MTHTPAPWRATCHDVTEGMERGDSGIRYWSINRASGYHGEIASVHSALKINGITLEERDANARLIETAPELLDALIGLVPADFAEHPGDFTEEWHVAYRAIARATTASKEGEQDGRS